MPDREPSTLATWLHTNLGVKLITRDRSTQYAEGVREGAPRAVQVADCWHLLKHRRKAVQRFLTRQHVHRAQAAAMMQDQQRA